MRRGLAVLLLLVGASAAGAGPLTGIGNGIDLHLHLDRVITLGPTFGVAAGGGPNAAAGQLSLGAQLLVFRNLPFDIPGSVSRLCALLSCRDQVAPDRPAFDPVLFQLGIEAGWQAPVGGHVHISGGYGVGPVVLGVSWDLERAAGEQGDALGPELMLNRRLSDGARSPVLQLSVRADIFIRKRDHFDDRVLVGLRLLFDLI